MSLPNPINVTYVSPSVEDTFPFQYIVKDTDNIVNIDTTNGAVDVILRNIQNSGMLQFQTLLSINDGGNNASVNNITIYPSEGDIINDSTSFVLNTDGANSIVQISNINQWVTTSSQASGGGGGTLLDGLSYTYVYGNGATPLENGQQLLDGYEDAITKVSTSNNITINYGALSIVEITETQWFSEDLDVTLLQPYYGLGKIELGQGFTLTLDGVEYNAIMMINNLTGVLRIEGYVNEPYPEIGLYSNAIILYEIRPFKSVLIVGAGYYELTDIFQLTNQYVDVVSLTGNCDVFITNINAELIDGLYYTAIDVNLGGFFKGINTGTQAIISVVNSSYTTTFENCKGGNFSFSTVETESSINCTNCIGGDYSFGGLSDTYGTFINCKGGIYSFSGSELYGAYGTYIDCEGIDGHCFGGLFSNGYFRNCSAFDYCFGYTIDSTSNGTFIGCYGGDYCFGSTSSGYFLNCTSGFNGFGAIDDNSIASGTYINCIASGENNFGATATGEFYDCKNIGEDSGSSFGYYGDASGYFYNCVGRNSFGSGSLSIASGIFVNCDGKSGSFGYFDASGSFYNCIGVDNCFGELSASGSFYHCTAFQRSFCGNNNNDITAQAYGYFYNCTGYNICFGSFGNASGYFLNCTSDGNSFGYSGIASGKFYNCSVIGNSFGAEGIASGYFQNCSSENGSFGNYLGTASGVFIDCSGGFGSFGGDSGTASGTFTNCTGGDSSFGGGNLASGTFVNCTALADSFGGDGGVTSGNFVSCTAGNDGFGTELTGILSFCKLTTGTYPIVSLGGITRYCLDGNNATNNQG